MTTSHTLKVPDATLYYEKQGSGPLLLLIAGGPTDAGVFAGLAPYLASQYTVVAYDPRGNSRSVFDHEPVEQVLDVHGDDAARLIEVLGGNAPAYVFGTSGGAQIGLNLAARHPDRVRTLVAHEPPCILLLEDSSEALAVDQEVHETYRRHGVEAAMQRFMEIAGMDGEPQDGPPPTPEAMETFSRIQGNMEYFLAHGILPLSTYVPDIEALREGSARIVPAVGEQTEGQIAHRAALSLARRLETNAAIFPGDHGGYEVNPERFAESLRRELEGG